MQQLFRLLIYLLIFLKSALYVSGDKFAHPQEDFFDCIYSFWYNAPKLLPTGTPVGSSVGSVGALYQKHIKKTSVALVRERTIPTERPPPVGEVSANFCG